MSKFEGNNAAHMLPALREEHLEFKLGIRAKGYVRQRLDLQNFVMLSSAAGNAHRRNRRHHAGKAPIRRFDGMHRHRSFLHD